MNPRIAASAYEAATFVAGDLRIKNAMWYVDQTFSSPHVIFSASKVPSCAPPNLSPSIVPRFQTITGGWPPPFLATYRRRAWIRLANKSSPSSRAFRPSLFRTASSMSTSFALTQGQRSKTSK